MGDDVHEGDTFQFDLFGPGEADANAENGIIEAEVARVNSKVEKSIFTDNTFQCAKLNA